MGIFSTTAVTESAITIDLDKVTPAFESANFVAMSYEVVAESEANYNKIMQAIGVNELSYFEENGTEIVYEASGIAGFIESAKKFFKNLWDKVKEIFHKFLAWLDSLTKSNKDFVKKYRDEATKRWSTLKDDFAIKGYKFENLDGAVNWTTVDTEAKKALPTGATKDSIPKTKDELETLATAFSDGDWENKARALIAKEVVKSSDDALDEAEFKTALSKGFRGGETSKISIEKKDLDLNKAFNDCSGYTTAKKNAESAFKTFEATIKQELSDLDKWEKEENKIKELKDGEDNILGKYTNAVSKIVGARKTIKEHLTTANGAYLQALKDQATQAKTLITAVITTGKVQKESADVTTESASTMDYLKAIVLK